MCGIVALLSRRGVTSVQNALLEGIRSLRNRGYDSCGVMMLSEKSVDEASCRPASSFLWKKASTSTSNSMELMDEACAEVTDLPFICGMAHTRWSTHGPKTDANAHPHWNVLRRFAVVHNGIITNYAELKKRLIALGVLFVSETDTEVIPHLLEHCLRTRPEVDVSTAWQWVVGELEGTWSLVMMDCETPDRFYVAKNGSPLLMAYTDDMVWVASEAAGFGIYAQKYLDLKDGTVLCVCRDDDRLCVRTGIHLNEECFIETFRAQDVQVNVHRHQFEQTPMPFDFWTNKEIHEQPQKLWEALNRGGRLYQTPGSGWHVKLGGLEALKDRLFKIRHLVIIGCGTSLHASLMALPVFRQFSIFTTVQVMDAGEMTRHDLPVGEPGTVALVVVSQSGETKDCQRVMAWASEHCPVIGVVNGVGSWIARQSNCGIYLNAGREVGVASTKSFTSQVVVLTLLALWFAQSRGEPIDKWAQLLHDLPRHFQQHLSLWNQRASLLVPTIKNSPNLFLLGRGFAYPLCLEAALKIKELSYQNAEGYAGGALKHGPFAMIDSKMQTPVILHVWQGPNETSMLSAVEQVYCRGARVIVLFNRPDLLDELQRRLPNAEFFLVDVVDEFSASLVSVMLYQFLAFKLAVSQGYQPDFPRNLAKVVTVDG